MSDESWRSVKGFRSYNFTQSDHLQVRRYALSPLCLAALESIFLECMLNKRPVAGAAAIGLTE